MGLVFFRFIGRIKFGGICKNKLLVFLWVGLCENKRIILEREFGVIIGVFKEDFRV